uniref:Uncharacterized protein n=1 Tax=Arundo donax TaxID=35708 RepID=A0A0A9GPY0_ARUDO
MATRSRRFQEIGSKDPPFLKRWFSRLPLAMNS